MNRSCSAHFGFLIRFFILLAVLIFYDARSLYAQELSPELEALWRYEDAGFTSHLANAYVRKGLKVNEVYYTSKPFNGKPVSIFAYYVYPKNKTGLPAILLVHGGGGGASLNGALAMAKEQFAVLAIDLPGKGTQRKNSRSTGPNMDVTLLLLTNPHTENNYLVHAAAAARNGITFLERQNEVDKARIGIMGLSWGGVIALIINGLDKRLKAAVNVFGAGFLDEGSTWQEHFKRKRPEELDVWRDFLDPRNFLKTQNAPVLFLSGTDDHCFYLPIFQKSYAAINAEKTLFLVPNLNHNFSRHVRGIAMKWMDKALKPGAKIPESPRLTIHRKDEKKIVVEVNAGKENPVESATLYYSAGRAGGWTKKQWQKIKPYRENGIFYFSVPQDVVSPEIQFFVSAQYASGHASTTPVQSLFKAKASDGKIVYSVASPVTRSFKHAFPLFVPGHGEIPSGALFYSNNEKLYYLHEG